MPETHIARLERTQGEALRAFLVSFRAHGEEQIPAYFLPEATPIEKVVGRLRAEEQGEIEEPGRVPATTRFAMGGDGAILGLYNARHRLNAHLELFGGHIGFSVSPGHRGRGVATALLGHAIAGLRGRGLGDLLVTCDRENLASARVIEKQGGVLLDCIWFEELGLDVCRYRIAGLVLGLRAEEPVD